MQTRRRHPPRPATLLAAAVVLLATGCTAGTGDPVASDPAATAATATVGPLEPSEPFGLTTVTLRAPSGGQAIDVPAYDAFEPEARRRGLMQRQELPAGAGMVFRFPGEHQGGFWMKNTLIPLSIAYFDASGEILEVMDMPPCTKDPCPSYDPGVAYTGALEVNRGFFDEAGVTPGWSVEVPAGLPPAR